MLGNTGVSGVLNWTRTSSRTSSAGTGPETGNGGSGFIHLEASNVQQGYVAAARVQDMLMNNMDYCFSFDYHMMG